MPLRDPFQGETDRRLSSGGALARYTAMLCFHLMEVFPEEFIAEPRLSRLAGEYEVRVFDLKRDRRLVAAIELVTPSNKDRPESRQVFVAKCQSLLRQGVSLVIIDVVTVRACWRHGSTN